LHFPFAFSDIEAHVYSPCGIFNADCTRCEIDPDAPPKAVPHPELSTLSTIVSDKIQFANSQFHYVVPGQRVDHPPGTMVSGLVLVHTGSGGLSIGGTASLQDNVEHLGQQQ
jgi:hypothetical protein